MLKQRSLRILGIKINSVNLTGAVDILDGYIDQKNHRYICVCPVSTIVGCQKDKEFKRAVNLADFVTPDGVPLVWLSRLIGYSNIGRVYGPDLMSGFLKYSQGKEYRHFFYGGTEGVLDRLIENLGKEFPSLKIAGRYSPPFRKLDSDEDKHIIDVINKACPDVLWIGIGSPKQEKWMYEHLDKVNAKVMVGVGAAFDFLSGTKKQAPKWMQKMSLEWLFRLLTEPRRLWKRYLFGNSKFLYLLYKESISGRLFKRNRRI